jgi:hypothetical protein
MSLSIPITLPLIFSAVSSICCVTDAPDELTNKFFDQIAFARELENVERAIDRKSGKVSNQH